MDPAAQEFISHKQLAVVGVSRNKHKFGNTIFTELKQRGYQTFAVNPSMEEIGGEKCYPNLTALQGQVNGVVVCIPPEKVEPVLQEAAASGLKNVWIQRGAESPAAIKAGQELGLQLVTGKCILMYAEPVTSFHSFHRFFAKIFGKH